MSGINDSATGGYIIDVPPFPPGGDETTAVLQQMIVSLTGLPGTLVRPRWQPTPPTRPAPEITWASLGITKTEADEYPSIIHEGQTVFLGASGPGADRLTRHSTVTVLVTFYGPQAETCSALMRDGLHIQQNWEPLAPMGLKFLAIHDLVRAPELVNQQWIDRFDIEIEMRRQVDRRYPVLNLNGADVILHTDTPDVPDTELVTTPPDTVIDPN